MKIIMALAGLEAGGAETHVVELSKEIKRRVMEVLDLVGLKHKARMLPTQLSGGEQQRVSIARSIVNSPKVVIADEPTGNLDPKNSMEVMQILDQINQRGITVIVSTLADTANMYFSDESYIVPLLGLIILLIVCCLYAFSLSQEPSINCIQNNLITNAINNIIEHIEIITTLLFNFILYFLFSSEIFTFFFPIYINSLYLNLFYLHFILRLYKLQYFFF